MTTDYLIEGRLPLSPGDAAVALVVTEDGRYLLQLRDQKPGIFFPGRWGVFGGAIDAGETPLEALRRELAEELSLHDAGPRYFTRVTLDFSYAGEGLGEVARHYYELSIRSDQIGTLKLGEGREMRVYSFREIVGMSNVVPYDYIAIWMHATRGLAPMRPSDTSTPRTARAQAETV
jgi:8-oxo-dGTP pyrophosphatase MutT (NUDIX family)